MRVSFEQDDFQRCGFKGNPEEQDGYPRVDFLFAQLAPTWFSGGRRGLASALAFLESVSGKLTFDSKITPLTASIIRDLLPQGEVFIDSNCIDFKPTDIQQGGSTLHVGSLPNLAEAEKFVTSSCSEMGGIRQSALALVPNDGIRGYWSSPQFRIVPSNLWLIERLSSSKESLNSILALALMYSEDLSARKIKVYSDLDVDGEYIQLVKQAFFTVGINLEVHNANA